MLNNSLFLLKFSGIFKQQETIIILHVEIFIYVNIKNTHKNVAENMYTFHYILRFMIQQKQYQL